jgi:hypothetical protein
MSDELNRFRKQADRNTTPPTEANKALNTRARARVRDNNSHRFKTGSTSVRFRLSPSYTFFLCMATHTRVYTHKEIQNSGRQNSQYTHLAATAPKIVLSIQPTNVKLKSSYYFGTFGNINIITFLQKQNHTQTHTHNF